MDHTGPMAQGRGEGQMKRSARGCPPAIKVVSSALALLVLSACSSQVDRNIERLAEGGDGVEDAKMALKLARKSAIQPLLSAFQKEGYTPKARGAIMEALGALYIREKDRRILDVLVGAVDDRDVPVRRVAVGLLGDLNKAEHVGPLVDRLGREEADEVSLEILVTLGIMGMAEEGILQNFGRQMTTDKMAEDERERFVGTLSRMRQESLSDTLMAKTLDWLEAIAEEGVAEAGNLLIKADVAGAEKQLLGALELVPDSKNVMAKLAKFYYDNGSEEKGLQLMFDAGAALRVRRLTQAPEIDGMLDDPVWGEVEPLTEFYQNINRMRAYPSSGRSEAYIGYRRGKIYIGVKGYEPSTDNLYRKATERDQIGVWQDDCVEIFFDPGRSYLRYYQIVVNNIGTVFDQYSDGTSP